MAKQTKKNFNRYVLKSENYGPDDSFDTDELEVIARGTTAAVDKAVEVLISIYPKHKFELFFLEKTEDDVNVAA